MNNGFSAEEIVLRSGFTLSAILDGVAVVYSTSYHSARQSPNSLYLCISLNKVMQALNLSEI
jgi:hypothetical protein